MRKHLYVQCALVLQNWVRKSIYHKRSNTYWVIHTLCFVILKLAKTLINSNFLWAHEHGGKCSLPNKHAWDVNKAAELGTRIQTKAIHDTAPGNENQSIIRQSELSDGRAAFLWGPLRFKIENIVTTRLLFKRWESLHYQLDLTWEGLMQ